MTDDQVIEGFNIVDANFKAVNADIKSQKKRIDLLREIVQQQSGLNSTIGDKLVDLFTRYNDVEFRLAQIEKKLNEIMS